jgi:hypothetical protein
MRFVYFELPKSLVFAGRGSSYLHVVQADPGVRCDLAVLSQLNYINWRRVARRPA